jgi:hypothetical protein
MEISREMLMLEPQEFIWNINNKNLEMYLEGKKMM